MFLHLHSVVDSVNIEFNDLSLANIFSLEMSNLSLITIIYCKLEGINFVHFCEPRIFPSVPTCVKLEEEYQ